MLITILGMSRSEEETPEMLVWLYSCAKYDDKNRFIHRKCAVRVFVHESQNFRNEQVSVANE